MFQFKVAEFLYMLLFGAATLLSISLLLPSFGLVVLNGPFVFMLLYVWSKHYPTQNVSIMGLFQVQVSCTPLLSTTHTSRTLSLFVRETFIEQGRDERSGQMIRWWGQNGG